MPAAPPCHLVALSLIALPMAAATMTGCGEDDVVSRQRPGPGTTDAGGFAPLPIEVGDAFTWQATLTYRGSGAQDEGSAIYRLTLAVTGVDDQGPGQSALTVEASGENTLSQDWTEVRDFDPWVARVGPTSGRDTVAAPPAEVALDGFPVAPDPPNPKVLPAPELFFIDVRDIEDLQSAFVTRHDGKRPQVIDPESGDGTWQFRFDGPDETISRFFPIDERTRAITLRYNAQGVLQAISETVGTSAPTAIANLNRAP